VILNFIDIEGLDTIGINVYGVKGVGKVEQAITYIKSYRKNTRIFEA